MEINKSDLFTSQMLLFEGAMAVAGALLAWLCGLDLGKAFTTPDCTTLLIQLGYGLIFSGALIILFTVLEKIPLRCFKDVSMKTHNTVTEYFQEATRLNRFFICFMAGVGEEILFRGFLLIVVLEYWPWGLEYNLNVIMAVGLSSLLFGLGHFVTPLYFVLTGLIGIAFSLLFLWTGFLIAPVIAHALYDYVAVEMALKEKT